MYTYTMQNITEKWNNTDSKWGDIPIQIYLLNPQPSILIPNVFIQKCETWQVAQHQERHGEGDQWAFGPPYSLQVVASGDLGQWIGGQWGGSRVMCMYIYIYIHAHKTAGLL